MTVVPYCPLRENTGGSQRLAKAKFASENYNKSRFHFKGELDTLLRVPRQSLYWEALAILQLS